MNYQLTCEGIKIFDKRQFSPRHILDCGQVFCYDKRGDNYISYPQNQFAEIIEFEKYYLIKTKNVDFFVDYFDLSTNYEKIKCELGSFQMLKEPILFGYGIRILNQDLFETLLSFIISANNNIKRIKVILNNIRRALGEKIGDNVYSLPTYEVLKAQDEDFYKKAGAGYRAKYLIKMLHQITPQLLEEWRKLDTAALRTKLVSIAGVGPKVADCILLFGYHRGDSFPVDTWMAKMYNMYFEPIENRNIMRDNLVKQFGKNSGYAQQYLFYYIKENNQKS
ncbi:MAG: DNA-3-methyladenine glycosylase 2 family protein [Clostridia bacterium]|nr:DNA-3-methyladenine glycosylase 2 family protein [Clostridia bacterium]